VTSVATPAATVTAPSDDSKKRKKKPGGTVVAAEPVSFADGETAYHERRYGQAAELFRRHAERHPGVPWGHFMQGLSCWKDGDLAEAEASFRRALSVAPDHLKSLQNLSRVLIEQGRLDESSELLRVAVDLDPTSNATYRLLGRVFDGRGKVDEAFDAYRHAIVLDDEDEWAMNNLALMYIDRGRYDEAVRALARAVTLRDDVPSFHNNLGIALEHLGRFSSSVDAYRSALLVDPAYEKASMNLARVEVVRERPTIEPFDLDVVAQRFTDALLEWNVEAVVEP
jgi:Flp pilus assembly protein TadD